MRIKNLVKIAIVAIALIGCLFIFLFTRKSETQTVTPIKTPEKIIDAASEVAGYNKWTKVNDKPQIMDYLVRSYCAPASGLGLKNPHSDKYINVYVNSIGEDEMLTKKYPKFPVGTILVKEKLSSPDRPAPELLTVMIKRDKDFNA
ncbi:MAG TPA: hypothetical protein VNB22_12600, partial [Pyrinomonadaceae bacterium]|nr:hypothetical protein [Pyrinomonadaceae bacterium]